MSRLVRMARTDLAVGVALVGGRLSDIWAEMSESNAWQLLRRYKYRSRHHRNPLSNRMQIDASLLTLELYYERMKRLRDVKINPAVPLQTHAFKNRWRRSWRKSQETAFINFTEIVEAQTC